MKEREKNFCAFIHKSKTRDDKFNYEMKTKYCFFFCLNFNAYDFITARRKIKKNWRNSCAVKNSAI